MRLLGLLFSPRGKKKRHSEATKLGMRKAKQKGVRIGRPSKVVRLDSGVVDVAIELNALGLEGQRSISKSLGISPRTFRRIRKERYARSKGSAGHL